LAFLTVMAVFIIRRFMEIRKVADEQDRSTSAAKRRDS